MRGIPYTSPLSITNILLPKAQLSPVRRKSHVGKRYVRVIVKKLLDAFFPFRLGTNALQHPGTERKSREERRVAQRRLNGDARVQVRKRLTVAKGVADRRVDLAVPEASLMSTDVTDSPK